MFYKLLTDITSYTLTDGLVTSFTTLARAFSAVSALIVALTVLGEAVADSTSRHCMFSY